MGVHVEPGGGVTSRVPGGEIMPTVDFAGEDFCSGGDLTSGFGGGVLAGLGWRGHSPAGGAVLALGVNSSAMSAFGLLLLARHFLLQLRLCCCLGGCQVSSLLHNAVLPF